MKLVAVNYDVFCEYIPPFDCSPCIKYISLWQCPGIWFAGIIQPARYEFFVYCSLLKDLFCIHYGIILRQCRIARIQTVPDRRVMKGRRYLLTGGFLCQVYCDESEDSWTGIAGYGFCRMPDLVGLKGESLQVGRSPEF